MDFGFMSNWRGVPRPSARQKQSSRNYHSMAPNNKHFLNTTDIVYDPISSMSNWNRVFYNTTAVISDKKFSSPFEFEGGKKMTTNSSSRLNRGSPQPINRPRVDFYPVFVGVSNFISGIVNNITGIGKEETVANSPPIIRDSDAELCKVSADENITANHNMNRTTETISGRCAAMDGKARESADAEPAKTVNVAEVNGCVVSICEDKLQKLKEMFAAAKKAKSRCRGSAKVKEAAKVEAVAKEEDKNIVETVVEKEIDGAVEMPESKEERQKVSEEEPSECVPPICLLKSILKSKPCDFDEVKGRFRNCARSSECESDDSFVIVFQEAGDQSPRPKPASECESEDSFVVCFEEPAAATCFTNEDVFTDEGSDSSCSDDDEPESSTSLGGSLSRSISNLADQSLYAECVASARKQKRKSVKCENVDEVDFATGLMETKPKPVKKVQFTNEPPRVHIMCTWAFAHRAARIGPWERAVTDRERFKRRIADADLALSWVLKPQHRLRVLFQRIMPWRHAQRRLEIAAAKKKKEEEERVRKEKEDKERAEREKEEAERAKKEAEERSVNEHIDSISESDIENVTLNGDVDNSDNACNVINCGGNLDTENNNVTDCNDNPMPSQSSSNNTPCTSAINLEKIPNQTNSIIPTDLQLNSGDFLNHELKKNKTVNGIKHSDITSDIIKPHNDLKAASNNYINLNNVLTSTGAPFKDLDEIAQEKLANVVNKNSNGISNCLLTNGASGSLQLLPLRDKMPDVGNINKSDIIMNNVTIMR